MIRFAYFTADGKMAGESYHQAYIYQNFLPAHGVQFDCYPAMPAGMWSLWRKHATGTGLVSRLFRRFTRDLFVPVWRVGQFTVAALRSYDGFLMGRCLSQPEALPWLEALLGWLAALQHKPFVLYLPDAMHLVYPRQYEQRFRACSHVLAVTPWLEGEMKTRGLRSFLSRVPIDVTRYPMILHRKRKEVVIGFSGGHDNFPALLEIEDALASVLDRHPEARLLVVSGRPPAFKNRNLRYAMQKWMHDDPYNSSFELGVEEMLGFDIALAPLLHCDYARGKDSAKLRQYMALGLGIVGTDFGVNAEMIVHGVNGFVASTHEDWKNCLSQLIESTDLRCRMGLEARRKVEEEFDVRVQAARLSDELKKCLRSETQAS